MKTLSFYCLLILSTSLYAQQNEPTIDLSSLRSFKPQAGNWMIVGNVRIDPDVDVHEQPAPVIVESEPSSRKKKNRKSQESPPPLRKAVTWSEGTGILLNVNDATKHDALITDFEHGDIQLEFEVMLPRGSNSGIYLMGRYEVQLLDSWGVKSPAFSDMGGIYRNWEKTPGQIYMGKAPRVNASKAPGLWQKMRVAFRAPKFDAQGNKISNARFEYVELNGVRIHENVEVPLPTGGPLENNEKPTGPIMIQGDHGPVAFRNMKAKLMKELNVRLENISYKTYYGSFRSIADFISKTPAETGTSEQLTCEILEKENAYGVVYQGMIIIPEASEYKIVTSVTGGTKLMINGQELLNVQRADAWLLDTAKITLDAGTYPFVIENFKDASWMPPQLGLSIYTDRSYTKSLHAWNSLPPSENPVTPIFINPGSEPKLLRAFLDFNGKRSRRLTHTIGVGDPSGINYVYDLSTGNLVCMWRGDFVDATPMWHDRGDGSFKPMGAAQFTFTGQPLSILASEIDPFPSKRNENDFTPKGYVIDPATKLPAFKYTYRDIAVEDKIYPSDNNRSLTRELSLKGTAQAKLYFKIGEGKSIEKLENGTYAIDDRSYYIKPDDNTSVSIREADGKKELIAPVTSTLKYTIIW